MARREYLLPDERARFDTSPPLSAGQRSILLDLPQWAERYIERGMTPTNQTVRRCGRLFATTGWGAGATTSASSVASSWQTASHKPMSNGSGDSCYLTQRPLI